MKRTFASSRRSTLAVLASLALPAGGAEPRASADGRRAADAAGADAAARARRSLHSTRRSKRSTRASTPTDQRERRSGSRIRSCCIRQLGDDVQRDPRADAGHRHRVAQAARGARGAALDGARRLPLADVSSSRVAANRDERDRPHGAGAAPPAAPSPRSRRPSGLSPTRMFETAQARLLRRDSTRRRITGFEAFLKAFPRSERPTRRSTTSAKATRQQKRFDEAITAYNPVIQNYPTIESGARGVLQARAGAGTARTDRRGAGVVGNSCQEVSRQRRAPAWPNRHSIAWAARPHAAPIDRRASDRDLPCHKTCTVCDEAAEPLGLRLDEARPQQLQPQGRRSVARKDVTWEV